MTIIDGSAVDGGYRTTGVAVMALASLPSGFNYAPYIEAAHQIIDDGVAGGCMEGYSDAKLEILERWLAAHFAVVSDGRSRKTSRSVNGASVSYSVGSLGKGLEGTVFGQQVLLMDTNGCLRTLGSVPMSISFVGEAEDE